MKYLLKILAFIPLSIELLLLLVVFTNKVDGVVWVIHIALVTLLTLIGVGILSKKKVIQQVGNITLFALTLLLCIMGYYDFIQWFTSIVGVILFIYFTFVRIAIKKLEIA